MTKNFRSILGYLVVVFAAFASPTTQAQTIPAGIPGRIEVHSLASTTLSTDEFLLGNAQGKPVLLGGELRLPVGTTAKFPAVILVHGSGGIGGAMDMWIHHLNQAGIATFVVDTFSGRGIVSTVQDQTQLGSLSMMVDAYKALELIAAHPRIDAKHIYVMGFSKGAVASIFSASTRFKKMYGGQAQFAGHIGLYTPCNTRYIGDTDLTGAPLRLFHGITDDYVNIIPTAITLTMARSHQIGWLYPRLKVPVSASLLKTSQAILSTQNQKLCSAIQTLVSQLAHMLATTPSQLSKQFRRSSVSLGKPLEQSDRKRGLDDITIYYQMLNHKFV